MKTTTKKVTFFFSTLVVTLATVGLQTVSAQSNDAINHPGGFIYFNSKAEFTASVSLPDAIKAVSKQKRTNADLLKEINLIGAVVLDAPVVNPLKSFNVMPDFSSPRIKNISGINVKFLLFPFYKDKKSSHIKQASRWSSDIEVAINNPYILFNSYFDRDVSRVYGYAFSDISPYDRLDVIPPFHYKREMYRDAGGFWIVKGIKTITTARIIEKKGIPLLVPVTKEAYIKYTIRLDRLYIKKTKKAIEEKRNNLEHAEKNRQQSDVIFYRRKLARFNKYVTYLDNAIKSNQEQLKKRSSEELKSAAYVDFSRGLFSLKSYNELVAPSDKDGKKLVMINPVYFDENLPKDQPQLIIVAYSDHLSSSELSHKLKGWFDQIDYQKLQSIVQ